VAALRRRLTALVLVTVVVLGACADDRSADGYPVRSEVLSHETTQGVLVFEPEAEGPWPVLMAYHGIDGTAEDMTVLGEQLAAEGSVVFAPTYRTDMSSMEGLETAARDGECGYRFARSVAADHGGDLEQPMTWVGWSLGALFAVEAGLREPLDPTGEGVRCFPEPPRPDLIVAVAGCYYESEGRPFDLLEPAAWTNRDVRIVVVAGEDDTRCSAAQSERLAADLRARGFDVRYELLEGADHFAPVFHRLEGEAMVPAPDSPAGDELVRIITDAMAGR
jgi:dienelactone hydrolase